ncbi:MAG: hypothetical protein HEP71_25925 [Roseivirga sp.]|nr:hypothetical protein [Roseivirga sp.]
MSEDMNDIWHVSSKDASQLNLWKSQPGHFRIIQFGLFVPLLTGSDYTLAHQSLIPAFDCLLRDQLEIKPANILRASTGDQWVDYQELVIKEHINPEKIKTTECFGDQIWQFRHLLFVSADLKQRLESMFPEQLRFSLGFSWFAG